MLRSLLVGLINVDFWIEDVLFVGLLVTACFLLGGLLEQLEGRFDGVNKLAIVAEVFLQVLGLVGEELDRIKI